MPQLIIFVTITQQWEHQLLKYDLRKNEGCVSGVV